MRRALVAVALALAAPAAASAAPIPVAVPGLSFQPDEVVALVGDTVTWTNTSPQSHTVTADDGSFDSGTFRAGERYEHTFAEQGTFPYYCAIHPFMTGEVDVFAIALAAPGEAVRPRGQATLAGKAPAGTASVTIEAQGPDGSFLPLGTAAPAEDGSFTFDVAPAFPTAYRAVSGELSSPAVVVSVSARIALLVLRGTGPEVELLAYTVPMQPRAPVLLERYVRERFTWVTVRRARLDAGGKARLEHTPKRNVRLRVRLLRGVGGYGPAVSPSVLVRPRP